MLLPWNMHSEKENKFCLKITKLSLQEEAQVNAIAPGTVKTPTVDHNISVMPEENKKALDQYVKQNYALKRIGEPEEVSGIAVYLASDKARWVTGSIFNIDGGLTAT
jgi:NAD(P)-dependent dehydrogenase (short-subunit alcohol dehydrogenase family)